MASSIPRRLKHWGWGYEDQQPSGAEVAERARAAQAHLGFGDGEAEDPVPIEAVELAQPRLEPPPELSDICAADVYTRALHSYGRAYRDVVRAFRGQFDNPPDFVARPRDEEELERVLEWCSDNGAAAIPFGGGTSVVGGVEPRVGDGYEGAVSIDLKALDAIIEVDPVSRAARVAAGITGPRLEEGLAEHGLTMRHYPQSFEYSTLGGWIVTRAGGHYATLLTHVDDLVESVRAITPTGAWESRRLPGSGAGPSPDRMLIGSEGTLGVVTEAWVRLQERPGFRASAGVGFADLDGALGAARGIAQSGLWPANCRVLDPAEAALNGAASEGAVLVLGFESAHHAVDEPMRVALEICAEHGGSWPDHEPRIREPATGSAVPTTGSGADADGTDAAAAWRAAFLQMPYMRDSLIAGGIIAETFETSMTWERLPGYIEQVRAGAEEALRDECGAGRVTCRLTHVYPDGAAPYFTVVGPAKRGGEIEQWDAIKAAVSEVISGAGGTITHHHAVGRDHRPWYDRQRPDPFAHALRAAKHAVDPNGILNPGVLIDP